MEKHSDLLKFLFHIKINVKRMFKIEKSRLKDLLRVIKSVRIDSTCILYL